MKQLRNELSKELLELTNLETLVQEKYEDKEIFKSINEYKNNGLVFFLKQNNVNRSLYEARNLNKHLIGLLTEV